ncbi:MAG: hypothetical protein L3J22_11065 [Xanthomonadales bacterium]|nr:hypothetical protein [Xanthomonadales bacterium]
MTNTSLSLPFKNNDTYEGFAVTEGCLKINDNSLVFEFFTKDSMIGLLKSEVKQVVVGFEDIAEISFQKSIFGNKLKLRLSNFMLAQKLPAPDAGEVKLRIARKDREIAASFVSKAQLAMSDYHYKTSEAEYKDELSKAIDEA